MNNAIAQMLSGRAPAQRPQQNAIGNAVPQQMKAAMPRPQMPRPQMPGPQMPGPQMPNMAQGMQNQMQPPTQPTDRCTASLLTLPPDFKPLARIRVVCNTCQHRQDSKLY